MDEVKIDRITADLEKKYTGDIEHDVKIVQDYCRSLPPCEESAKLISALSKYASEKFPDAEEWIVLELEGVPGASSTIERSNGINEIISQDPEFSLGYCQRLVEKVFGDLANYD